MQRIQIISIIVSILFLCFIIELIRKKLLKEAYSIVWLFFCGIFLFFSCWRQAIDYFASVVGIYYPPVMVLLLLIFALVCVLVQFSIVVSRQNDQIRKLAQKLALLENKINNENEKK